MPLRVGSKAPESVEPKKEKPVEGDLERENQKLREERDAYKRVATFYREEFDYARQAQQAARYREGNFNEAQSISQVSAYGRDAEVVESHAIAYTPESISSDNTLALAKTQRALTEAQDIGAKAADGVKRFVASIQGANGNGKKG